MCQKHIFLGKKIQKSTPKTNKKHFSQAAKLLCNLLIVGELFVILFQFDVSFRTCFFISSFSSCVFFYNFILFFSRAIASIIFIYNVIPEIGFVGCQIIFLIIKCIQYQ